MSVNNGWLSGRVSDPSRVGCQFNTHPGSIASNLERKKKGKEEYLYNAFIQRLRALRHGSHSFTCKLHHACLSFVSVHQMAPPLNVVANI